MPAALEVQQRMEHRGFPSDISTYFKLIRGYVSQADYASVFALQDQVLGLRNQLRTLETDTSATPAARAQATVLLGDVTWRQVFDLLIDAAVQAGEWIRAVNLLEVMMDEGIPTDPTKHEQAQLLQDAKPALRISQHLDLSDEILPEGQNLSSKKYDWTNRLPQTLQKQDT